VEGALSSAQRDKQCRLHGDTARNDVKVSAEGEHEGKRALFFTPRGIGMYMSLLSPPCIDVRVHITHSNVSRQRKKTTVHPAPPSLGAACCILATSALVRR
jgi:hypothetical protein